MSAYNIWQAIEFSALIYCAYLLLKLIANDNSICEHIGR